MLNLKIEEAADEVRAVHEVRSPPLDILRIAHREGIVLAPSSAYGPEFNGRIEYHRDKVKFILYYPIRDDGTVSLRHRFSVAHELGHYFLEPHRAALIRGVAHNSTPGFVCDDAFEREADEFAAALMIPRGFLERRLAQRDFLELKAVLAIAKECETSSQCAAIRYATYTGEACCVLLSRKGRICFNVSSDESRACGFSYISRIPPGSAAAEAAAEPKVIKEKEWDASEWFSDRFRNPRAFEESFGLGYDDYVLTLLSLEFDRHE